MRVVFDSNVLIAALVFPGGRADAALKRVVEGRDDLVLSAAIVDEILSVLARKFSRDREELARVAVFLTDVAEKIEPARRSAVLADEPDNRILECAVSAEADAIVTGDRAMLRLRAYEDIPIMSLRDFLER